MNRFFLPRCLLLLWLAVSLFPVQAAAQSQKHKRAGGKPAAHKLRHHASKKPLPPAFATRPEVQAFVAEMVAQHGFERATLLQDFAHVRPLPAVQQAVRPPRDPRVRSWREYRSRFIEPRRIEGGLRFWQQHQAGLEAASAVTGVPPEIIVAIIGIESIYGSHMGNFGTLAALATLAFDYPSINPATDAARAALFRRELEELLLLAREEERSPLDFRGSYAGALGWPQFLPGSIRKYAVDGDRDGRIDLVGSPEDALASVANFLAQHGWRRGEPVVLRAQVRADVVIPPLLAEGILPKRLPAEWAALGVIPVPASAVEASAVVPALPAALIDLVTPDRDTEYWLGFQNFYVITRYNRSSFYAMAVFDLAQALREVRAARRAEEPKVGSAAPATMP